MCLAGASRAGAELLTAVPHPDLRVQFVWAPVLPPDSVGAATAAAARLSEPRARHYWDSERRLAAHLGEALAISAKESLGVEGGPGLAWDVYLAYERGNNDLTGPWFWMHQLGVKHAPRLDAAAFGRRVEELLAAPARPAQA
jgi:hypothetical protein